MYTFSKSLYTGPEMLLSGFPHAKGARSPREIFLFNKNAVRSVIGHCRSATLGAIVTETAHPFHVGNVLGVHNGTVKGMVPNNLTAHEKMGKKASDSFQIYTYLNEHTPEETYNHLDDEKKGAFALVWYNLKENTLNFMRNCERPLHYTTGGTVYFSSDRADLKAMMEKKSIYLTEIKSFEVGHHYSVDLKKPMEPMTKVKVAKEKVYSSGLYQGGHTSMFESYGDWHGDTATTNPTKIETGSVWNKNTQKYEKPSVPPFTITLVGETSVPTVLNEKDKAIPCLNVTHHSFGNKRLIPAKVIKKYTDDCDCSNCSGGKIDLHLPVCWLLYDGDRLDATQTNEDFLNKSIMPICDKCAADKENQLVLLTYGKFVVSQPETISTH